MQVIHYQLSFKEFKKRSIKALDIAEREKWPKLCLYTDLWMVANALWGGWRSGKRLIFRHRGRLAAPLRKNHFHRLSLVPNQLKGPWKTAPKTCCSFQNISFLQGKGPSTQQGEKSSLLPLPGPLEKTILAYPHTLQRWPREPPGGENKDSRPVGLEVSF